VTEFLEGIIDREGAGADLIEQRFEGIGVHLCML
jgi:hypothetical protein